MTIVQHSIETPVGRLYLVASSKGIKSISWNKQSYVMVKVLRLNHSADKILSLASKQLDEYFSGTRKDFDIPLDLTGTDFQRKVWSELTEIPFGRTLAYRDIAYKINHPRAVRAVGSANGKNPVCIVVPCHRVIAADGSIGGFSAGIKKKHQLLAFEQKYFA